MLPEGTIDVQQIWKRFRPDRRRRLFRDELQRLRRRMTGDIVGGYRWALRDVNLHVAPGESVGLVGSNGAGKSTLLKILSRVMYPYAGILQVSGRVGALIEVRAGIHPDLTGRENVYLYGSLLGLPRRDVTKRFDEIVAFAELDDAIDRQVKFFSSGMQMRLGFAVAAFLEPDILLVDEVLAVGDASFQQKCLDRMRTVLSQGTSLIFVSHDLASVEATCSRGIWMRDGMVAAEGEVREVLGAYRTSIEETASTGNGVAGLVRVTKCEISGTDGSMPKTNEPLDVRMVIQADESRSGIVFVGVSEGPATPIFVLRRDVPFAPGQTEVRCSIEHLPLPRGRFFLWIGVDGKHGVDLLPWHPAQRFDVSGPTLDRAPRAVVRLAPVHVQADWGVKKR
ncbi:MAG TPA: polysaccharide ABC transporter ATP-binding protein [Actinomycetota bacterium]